MGNAPGKGRRSGAPGRYDEDWLQVALRRTFQYVVDEPVPKDLLEALLGPRDKERPLDEQKRQHIRRWRAKAEELRTAADSMSNETARSSLLQMARNYERMAEQAEKGARRAGDVSRGAG